MEIGVVHQIDINTEVKRAYLDYAMSVIVARALPDARDGLKPVQRRILYAMYDMGIRPNTAYKKSARIVGEVLGKYHPHGDSAVYEAMARMAQDFSVRYLLVDGQGNFGSIDGDSPAAMRYTEARIHMFSLEMLTDIDKETVDWTDNFDGTLREPEVLPARVPNLLVNGASGIAVGMSTSIPPHNLGEVVDACVFLLDHWSKQEEIGIEDLMQFVQGPDFPTGGLIYRRDDADDDDVLRKAYATGRGRVTMRARAHIEEIRGGRERIVITEIPYQVNKTTLIENIAKLVRSGKIEGIADLRDESDRQGMRLVIDLTRNANTHQVLEDLYQHTPLESRFSMILLALVDGEPRTLSLKKALTVYLEHRLEVLQRRSRYELERARQRAHIVEGLLIALDDLDTVIDIIRRSRTVETARNNLRKQLKLSEVQAQAILDMPLKRLAALERRKLQDEYKELQQTIKTLEALLKSPKKQRAAIREDLLAVRAAYADARRTRVLEVKGESVEVGALTPDEPAWVVVTREGRLGRQPDEGKPPRIPSRPQQTPLAVLAASTRDTLYLFTQEGLAVALPVHQIAEGEAWEGEGCPWSQVTRLDNGNVITALALPAEPPPGALFFVTAQGQVKRMAAEELPGVGREPAVAVRLDAGDALREVLWVTEEDEVVLGSAHGQGIRFAVAEVRPTGASAGGMAGMRLEQKDEVVGATVVNLRMMLLTMTDRGAGKRSGFDEIPSQRRGGKGVQIAKLERGEQLAGIGCLRTTDPFVMTTVRGNAKTISGRVAPSQGRATHGDSLIALQGSDLVARLLVPQLRPEE